ncbi:MAG: hypothetical protein JO021_19640 [Alphaproteobacteria bacterium]|nr:hypothetical protein [Alphaproteobacteria bacterium]
MTQDLVPDAEAAVKIALAALVESLGLLAQAVIESFQPWTARAVGDAWEVRGTLNEGTHGGTFVVVVDRRDARIIKVSSEPRPVTSASGGKRARPRSPGAGAAACPRRPSRRG